MWDDISMFWPIRSPKLVSQIPVLCIVSKNVRALNTHTRSTLSLLREKLRIGIYFFFICSLCNERDGVSMVATSPCFYVHFPLVDKLCWAYESSKIGKTKKPVLWGAHSEKLGHYMHKPTTAPGRNWDLRGLLLIVLCPGQELQWKGVLISLLTSVSLFLFALVAGAFPLFCIATKEFV